MDDGERSVLEEKIKYLGNRVKRLKESRTNKNRSGRESALRDYVHDVVSGAIQDYLNQHGNPDVKTAKTSLLKRIQGQLCAPDTRRQLVDKIISCEQEAIDDAKDILNEAKGEG